MKKISNSKLKQLLIDSYKLTLLEAYGVDNWFGYSEALNDADEFVGMSADDFEDRYIDEELDKFDNI